ncbi:MAG: response regulator [Chitinispirillales bacterium]|jgi:signal transduction histidine kinase/CheY-like chemotaxis protein/PAS domain-containing protein|nr:response regulator [Chitinispirillales bacterium]
MENHTEGLRVELERLADACKAGDLNISLKADGLSRDTAEMVSLLNTALGDYRKFIGYRKKFYDALDLMDIIFLSQKHKSFNDAMGASLRPVADAVNLDSIDIYNLVDANGEKQFRQIYLWNRAKGGTVPTYDELNILPDLPVTGNWKSVLSRGGIVNLHTGIMSDDEKLFLSAYGVKSMLLVPVLVSGELWGCVAYRSNTIEEFFCKDSVKFLSSVARICAKHVMQEKVDCEIRHKNNFLDMGNEASSLLLTIDDDGVIESSLLASMEIVGRRIDVDRVQIWQNELVDGDLHFALTYEWLSDIGKQMHPVPMDVKFSYRNKPEWESMFLRGEYINGPLSKMPPEDQEFLSVYGIKTIVIIPLFLKGHFWGFFSVDDCEYEYTFTEEEINVLHSVSLMMASAINRRSLNEKIKDAYNRTKILLDATPLCCQLWNKNFEKIDCNEEAVRLFGFRNKQEYMERSSEFYPEYQPDGMRSTEKAAACIKKAFEEGQYSFDWTYKMLDGTVMPAHVTLVRIRHEDDYVVASYTRDIREHNEMINAIEHKDNLLLTVNHAAALLLDSELESFEDSLYKSMGILAEAVKVDRVYIWENNMLNGQLCHTQLYEWSEEAEPQQNKESAKNLPYSEVCDEWEEILSNGNCINGLLRQMPFKAFNYLSSQSIVSILVIPVFIKNRFWGIIGFDDCHTERVFTKEEESILRSCGLLFANALLRNEMVLGICDTSVKLEAALEQANAASRAKGDFLSNMSHEMRTPLNAIIGMTVVGKNAGSIERKDDALDKIKNASGHLLGVINDVLDMAKIEANKLELVSVEYDFGKTIQKIVTVISFRVNEKLQILSVNIDKNIPLFIRGDDQRLAQVITNLLSNAVKFTPKGGKIYLGVSLIGEDGENCELRIEVTDNGIGISPEQQEKLFLAFEQADSGTSREYGGTGLGLVISKRIIELMGGKIWIESELGKGARFIFTIKAKYGKKNEDLIKESLETDSVTENNAENTCKLDGKRLLVAEDIEINREILTALLEDTGLIIDCAGNGKEALDMVATDPEKYDIVFMDIQMPKMDGLEATRQIRALPVRQRGRLPIIAMTANVFKDDIEACLAAGMDEHLGKPLDIDKVLETLRKYLILSTSSGGS